MPTQLGPEGNIRRRGVLLVIVKTPEMHIPPWYGFLKILSDKIGDHYCWFLAVPEPLFKSKDEAYPCLFFFVELIWTRNKLLLIKAQGQLCESNLPAHYSADGDNGNWPNTRATSWQCSSLMSEGWSKLSDITYSRVHWTHSTGSLVSLLGLR